MSEWGRGSLQATFEPGSFVELRGRPWLVEEVQGELTDLQTLYRSCIADGAQGDSSGQAGVRTALDGFKHRIGV